MVEVVIAGAGPGGCALAAALMKRNPAMAGRILVLDRARFPREKPCGGGLTGHAAEAMEAAGLELDVASVKSPKAVVRFAGFEREVALPRPVLVIRREDFDASLVAQIRKRGVEVREGEGLADYRVTDGGVVATTTSGEKIEARVIVGADGAGSLVRKKLRPTRDPVPMRLHRAEIPVPDAWRGRDEMVYDFTPMGEGMRGYLWIFPAPGDRLNVGVLHDPAVRLGGADLVRLLRAGLERHGICIEDHGRGWPAWGYQPGAPVSAPRVLTIGDAAGIDALTGEGIAVAMEHAVIAAATITRGLATGDLRFAKYRRALRRATVGRELALDRWLARLLYASRSWRGWLSLVLFDKAVLELYAARVAGGIVLADRKPRLFGALFAHLAHWRSRKRKLQEALQRDTIAS